MEDMTTKRARCRFSFISFEPPAAGEQYGYDCHRNGLGDVIHNVTEAGCENCPHFKSKFIEYPVTINKIDVEEFEYNTALGHKVGEIVKIRPCGDEYHGKTYMGVLLGDLPMAARIGLNEKTQVLSVKPMYNPAIFVPELNKIIFGAESWWATVKSEDELTEISDELINNQWYMRMLKSIAGKEKENAGE